ncbi:hypothetical protein ABI59_17680 [Acidobacteria bacterium Mor1]|nr:hypothetical protein ABI59_17680 [Acidobacteria bacterium Mor1]
MAAAENIDPSDADAQFAYGENIGWINAEPTGCMDCGVHVSDFSLTGWMWAENIGWISMSCENDSSCTNADYGVRNDGHGALSGFAWSENVGWIHFMPATSGVTIDANTGEFAGRAWGENIGWITFAPQTGDPMRTDWCQSTGGPPTQVPEITLEKSGVEIQINWASLPLADWYELVEGDIGTLRSSGGDFGLATTACSQDNVAADSAVVPASTPGDRWFLLRGANCRGKGTYDSNGPGQMGQRDIEAETSGNDCP